MKRIVFVTQELAPSIPGGAGTLIHDLASMLSIDHHVTVVLVAPGDTASGDASYDIVHVAMPPSDGSAAWFVERSRRAAEALGNLVGGAAPDLVEFTDFEALGFWALAHRRELGLERIPLVVRLHGPIGAIAAAVGAAPEPWPVLDRLERVTLSMADAVVAPSVSMRDWVLDTYELDRRRATVGPPPAADVGPRTWNPRPGEIAFFGRLTEQKGVDDLVAALLPLFPMHPDLRLVVIGPDGWSAVEGRPMSELLRDRLGPWAPRVEFVGALERGAALDRLATASVVVMPSRFETFCLAAHEVRAAGLPVLVPPLPAFAPFVDRFLSYDGSVDGLTSTLSTILSTPEAVGDVAPPPGLPGSPTEVYSRATPTRHPRSQAGWGTLAMKTWESAQSPPIAAPDPGTVDHRLDAFERDVVSLFGAVIDPEISVVIACHDDGETLVDAVCSVFHQRHPSWEVIVVDDGSTDLLTLHVLDRLARWPRVSVLHQPNGGLASARNAGVRVASGRLIVPLDADDELMPRYMAALEAALAANPRAAYAHCWAELFGDVSAIWIGRPVNPYWEWLGNSIVGCVMIRRQALLDIGGYDESLRDGHEDWDLWLRLREAGWGQQLVAEPLFRYRKRGVSMSVRSEANFERGIVQIAERHQRAYLRSTLADRKQRHYPAVSVLVPEGSSGVRDLPGDWEAVAVGGDPGGAVAASTGKYLVHAGDGWPGAQTIADLVATLEADPDAPAADDGDVRVWRRWALVDPGAPLDRVEPLGSLRQGAYPDPAWAAPSAVPDGLRVDRYRPEEPADIPDWLPFVPPVAVIATVRNEVATITRLVDGLMAGVRPPDEIVITDAGSTDGTWEQLQELAARHPSVRPFRVEGNRSRGRNAAIAAARADVIACIDGGCEPDAVWLDRLTRPFLHGAEWVAGFYRPVGSARERAIGASMVYVESEAARDGFLPSARSMAFTKDAWRRAGCFDEALEVSEDTAFDHAMIAAGIRPWSRLDAVVGWHPPKGFRAQFRTGRAWSRSDAEAGIGYYYYVREARLVVLAGAVAAGLALITPWLAPLGSVVLVPMLRSQTRHKFDAVPERSRYLWVPLAWATWLAARMVGFLRGAIPRKVSYLVRRMRSAPRRAAGALRRVAGGLRRRLRGALGATLGARRDLRHRKKRSRANVDVYVSDRADRRRWLRITPDTWRVGLVGGLPRAASDIAVFPASGATPAELELAARLASTAEDAVGVVGSGPANELADPDEVEIGPVVIAMRPGVAADLGGVDDAPDLSVLLDRARQAGMRICWSPADGRAPSRPSSPVDGPAIVVVSGVPLHDVGGGSRGAQMSFELAGRGYAVAHVSLYPADESTDLGLRYLHPRLEQYSRRRFDARAHAARAREPGVAILELPHRDAWEVASALREAGWSVVYDLIDDWSDPALGWGWYDEAVERKVVAMASATTASAPDLVQRLERWGARPTLVPNAVNERLFGGPPPPVAADLPEGSPVLGYHGSLYGDWMDWASLAAVAEAYPAGVVVVIGDDRAPRPAMPDNVRFLGLRSQPDLPAYVHAFDVGLVPFKLNETTHAVSPLKVFEYLACGVPVAAPPLRALDGVDGVATDENLVTAVTVALQGPRPDRALALARHGWSGRMRTVLGTVGWQLADEVPPALETVIRRAVHHRRRHRVIR